VSPDVAETVIRLLIRSSLTTQEQASVVAHGSGSGRRALVIGGAGKMGAWFAQFLTSQGFDVEVADPKAVAGGVKAIADWRESPLTHDYIVVAAPLGATSAVDIDRDGKSIWIMERCGGQDFLPWLTLNIVLQMLGNRFCHRLRVLAAASLFVN